MNRRTALKLMAWGLGMGVTNMAEAQSVIDRARADELTLVNGNTEFAVDVYARLCENPGNLFFSPYSISTALAMTYAGARGQTAEEMAKTLHLSLDQTRLHPACGNLIANLKSTEKKSGCELHIANALWGQSGYHFLPHFLDLNKQNYAAGLFEVDFAGRTEDARRTINAWVEKQTKDKIKELLKPGVLDSLTRLVLTNAIYFKSNWRKQFDKKSTREEGFLVSADQKVHVPMMHQTSHFGYLDGGSFAALELPYTGKQLSMVIFLPKKLDSLAAFEKTVTTAKLTEWLPRLKEDGEQGPRYFRGGPQGLCRCQRRRHRGRSSHGSGDEIGCLAQTRLSGRSSLYLPDSGQGL